MKKITAVFMSAMLMISTMGCAASNSSPKSLKEQGLAIAETLDFLAESEDYTTLFTSSSSSNGISDIVEDIGKQDYSTPSTIFKLTGLEDAMLSRFGDNVDLSQEIKDIIGKKLSSAFGSQLNAMNGVSYVAATTILTYEKSFILKGVDKPVTYLYLYDGKYGVMVNYNPSEDNIVGASGSFVTNDKFPEVKTVDDLKSLLETVGITDVEISLAD